MSSSSLMAIVNAPTQFVTAGEQRYAYRSFGRGGARPLLCLQHFTGTLDNWDPLLTSALAETREVILFENAGLGRSTGQVPTTVEAMADHVLAFLPSLELPTVDILGFSLGGMVGLDVVRKSPSLVGSLLLVGTAPRGGDEIMHLDKPSIGRHLADPSLKRYQILQKIFFTPSDSGQAAGADFVDRLMLRQTDREPPAGDDVRAAQMAAFAEWSQAKGTRFIELKSVSQPTLVVNGVDDELIPVRNSYFLVENMPNATLLVYPDAGHGSLFQNSESFARIASKFLDDGSL